MRVPCRWHGGCFTSSAEGGTSKKPATPAEHRRRSRSELAGSSENGRGYEPRLKRQRTVLYDRLAWTFQTTNLRFRILRGMEGRLSAGPPFEPGQRF